MAVIKSCEDHGITGEGGREGIPLFFFFSSCFSFLVFWGRLNIHFTVVVVVVMVVVAFARPFGFSDLGLTAHLVQ